MRRRREIEEERDEEEEDFRRAPLRRRDSRLAYGHDDDDDNDGGARVHQSMSFGDWTPEVPVVDPRLPGRWGGRNERVAGDANAWGTHRTPADFRREHDDSLRQQRERSAACSPLAEARGERAPPHTPTSRRPVTHTHLFRRFSCLCLTHRPGDMCRPVLMGHRAFLRVRCVCVCVTRLTWGRCRVSRHPPTSRVGSRDIGRQRSSGRPGT